MSTIILDFGSGNSCQNDTKYIKRMYDELKAVDTGKHSIVCKWQLFEKAGENKPLLPECFEYAYEYGNKLGYKVTASVFDKNSLDFLLRFDIPFVKIANNRKLNWLTDRIPRGTPIISSVGHEIFDEPSVVDKVRRMYSNDKILLCVSKYPSEIKDYEEAFSSNTICGFIEKGYGLSDHTTNFGLWYRYQPEIIEWHYVLEHDPKNLDGGLFARTPAALAEVL